MRRSMVCYFNKCYILTKRKCSSYFDLLLPFQSEFHWMYAYCFFFLMKVRVKQSHVVLLITEYKLRCYFISINANDKYILLSLIIHSVYMCF